MATEKRSEPKEAGEKWFHHPERFEESYCRMRKEVKNPLYMTTMQQLGATAPTIHEMPEAYHPRPQKFSNSFTAQYRNYGLNTSKSKKTPSEYDLSIF